MGRTADLRRPVAGTCDFELCPPVRVRGGGTSVLAVGLTDSTVISVKGFFRGGRALPALLLR